MNTGAFGENFPYSNFHDLNMDWIIKIAKDFLDQYTNIQETIQTGLTDLDTTAQRLQELLQEWYDTHSEDIANQLAEALQTLSTTLQSTITSFNQSANAKAQEAIASIPADYTTLSNHVNSIDNNTKYLPIILGTAFLNNVYSILPAMTPTASESGKAWNTSGTPTTGSDYSYAKYTVSSSKQYLARGGSWGASWPLASFYDSSDNLLGTDQTKSNTQYNSCIITPPANTSYVIINGAYTNTPVLKELAFDTYSKLIGGTLRPFTNEITPTFIANHPAYAYMRNWESNIVYNISQSAYSAILDKPAGFTTFGNLIKMNGAGFLGGSEKQGYSQYLLVSTGRVWSGFDDGGHITWFNLKDSRLSRKYLIVGDSYCEGYTHDTQNSGWGRYLAEELNLTTTYYDIVYHGGAGFANGGFYDLINEKTYEDQYTDIIICGGYNDNTYTFTEIVTAIRNVIALCYNKGWFPNVYIGCIAYIKEGTGTGSVDNWQTVRQNILTKVLPAYKTGAAEEGIYLQNSEYLLGESGLSTDGYHPNETGNRTIAMGLTHAVHSGVCSMPYNSNLRAP